MNVPRLIRGTHDLSPQDYHAHRHVIGLAEAEAGLAGFQRVDTPIMEETRLFDRSLGQSSDIVGKEMYSFVTRGGEEVSLRPEGTAGVVRSYFSHGLAQQAPLRYFYAGSMFRYERPQKGRLRQFHQFGVELIGAGGGGGADLEIIALGDAILSALGVSDQVVLHLNTLGSQQDRMAYRSALIDYFTAYQGQLSSDSVQRLTSNPLRILDSKAEQDRALFENAPVIDDFLSPASKQRFADICLGLDDLGIGYHRDHNLVRGLDYYEHSAFEFITDALGAQGTVLGGGCYDRLFEIVGGKAGSGVGFAAGVERLAALVTPPKLPGPQCVLVPIGLEAEQKTAVLAKKLRQSGLSVVFGFSGKVKARMRHANQLCAEFCVIYGETEITSGQVKVKEMKTGQEEMVMIEKLSEQLIEMRNKHG